MLTWAVSVHRPLTRVVLLLSVAAAVEAQPPVPVYEVGVGELSIDGSLEDWRRLSIPSVVTELDFVVLSYLTHETISIPPPGGLDLTFEGRLAWSAEPSRLYAAFEIVDDEFLEAPHPDVAQGIYPNRSGDVVILGVDGDNGGGQYAAIHGWDWGPGCPYYIERGEWEQCVELFNGRIAQSWEVYAGPDGFSAWNGSITYWWGRWDIDPWPLDRSLTAAAGRTEPGVSTTMEIMVTPFDTMDFRGPEYSTPSRLSAGQTIGVGILMTDHDSEEPAYLYLLGNPEYPLYRAESFADALLVPAADRRTTVEKTTWGRLKGEAAAGD